MNVAIIVIATGAYIKFFKKLKQSLDKYFLPAHQKTIFLLTDHTQEWGKDVVRCPALKLPWPLPTLLRFDRFLELPLDGYDLVYYLDVDQEVVATITDEEVVPMKGQLVGVTHPYNHMPKEHMFETNPNSTAYCNPETNSTYYHANFFGGHREDFLRLSQVCAANIATDLVSSRIARWHDESHLNKYFSMHPPKALPRTFGYPSFESEDCPDKKILHYAKDQDSMRAYRDAKKPGSRGVVLLAAGNPCYGEYAANLAASMLDSDPSVKITLFCTPSAITSLNEQQKGYFEQIRDVPRHCLYLGEKPYYNRFKLFLPEVSPYDESYCFDVDSLWMSKLPVSMMFDFMSAWHSPIGGQCEAVVEVKEGAEIFKEIKTLRPLEDFHPPLQFKGTHFYQLHGQCLYATKTEVARQVYAQAVRLFDAMAEDKLTCKLYWVWHGQPIEELCITLATAMVGVNLYEKVTQFAPVSVQSEALERFDPFSTRRFILSINGYPTHEEAGKVAGYCMGEEVTAKYIAHYNNRVAELQAKGFTMVPYKSKIVEL